MKTEAVTQRKLRAFLGAALLLAVVFLLASVAWLGRPQAGSGQAAMLAQAAAELASEEEYQEDALIIVTMRGYPAWPPPEMAATVHDVAFLGTAVEVGPPRWNTPDGKQPEDFPRRIELGKPVVPVPAPKTHRIYTPVTFKVERYFKGAQPGDRLTLYFFGGQVGQVRMKNLDIPIPTQGQRLVVFLQRGPEPDPASLLRWVVGTSNYVITPDDQAVSVGNSTDRLPASELFDRIERGVRGQ